MSPRASGNSSGARAPATVPGTRAVRGASPSAAPPSTTRRRPVASAATTGRVARGPNADEAASRALRRARTGAAQRGTSATAAAPRSSAAPSRGKRRRRRPPAGPHRGRRRPGPVLAGERRQPVGDLGRVGRAHERRHQPGLDRHVDGAAAAEQDQGDGDPAVGSREPQLGRGRALRPRHPHVGDRPVVHPRRPRAAGSGGGRGGHVGDPRGTRVPQPGDKPGDLAIGGRVVGGARPGRRRYSGRTMTTPFPAAPAGTGM